MTYPPTIDNLSTVGSNNEQTEDELIRNLLQASAAFINCTNGLNGDNPTELTLPDIQRVIRILQGNNAESLMNNIEGENRFGTGPIR